MNQGNKQEQRVALVTGAARRIGAAIVTTLHDEGFRVVIHCHRSYLLGHELAKRFNDKRCNSALVVVADLTVKKDVIDMVSKIIAWAKRLDVLVNNASVFSCTPMGMNLEDRVWDELFNTNVKAPFWLSHLVFSYLSLDKGSIINLTDPHVDKPLKGYSVYCQTKAALTAQTKTLACEFAPSVRVNAVAPGAILWPEGDNVLSDLQQKKIMAKILLQQQGDPSYIAQAILALINNPFITGQVITVDGGRGLI